jgi:hypothetical protein
LITYLTGAEVKEKLKEWKLRTRVRCPQKLKQLLKDKLYAMQNDMPIQ